MRRYITIAFGLLLTAAASAQNLNPTVQVTNAYEGKLMEVEKQNLPMAVPDSLTRFDWNFNYSVFDNPYKGAYEFNPYLIDMKPDPVPYDGKNLYVRAGAGYTFHPELEAVWSPMLKNGLKLSVYDDFKGYWGQYHTMNIEQTDPSLKPCYAIDGNDAGNRFGVSARYDFKPVILSLDGKFDWLNSRGFCETSNNVFGESVSLRARSNAAKSFFFDAEAGFKNLSNRSEWAPLPYVFYRTLDLQQLFEPIDGTFVETGFNVDASFAYKLSKSFSLGLSASYENLLFQMAGVNIHSAPLNITPSVTFSADRFALTAGLRFSDVFKGYDVDKSLLRTGEDGVPFYPMADYEGKLIYPQAHISFEAIEDALQVYADLTGGQHFNSYSGFLESNHFFSGLWAGQYPTVFGDASVNTADVSLGLNGRIASRLQFDLKGGYSQWYNLPMESLLHSPFTYGEKYFLASPTYSFVNMDLFYGELDAAWKSDRLDISGLFKVQKSDYTRSAGALSLPLFSGSADVTYNWNRRLFFGVSAEWMTGRTCEMDCTTISSSSRMMMQVNAPGWVDLGINLEYWITSGMSLWLKGGNLLNQPVMRNLIIAEKGPYATAGICLNL